MVADTEASVVAQVVAQVVDTVAVVVELVLVNPSYVRTNRRCYSSKFSISISADVIALGYMSSKFTAIDIAPTNVESATAL